MALISLLALFMMGESLEIPFAPFLALPLVPLMKPLTAGRTGERVYAVLLIPCAAVTGAYTLYRLSGMAVSSVLPNTPLWVVAAVVLAVATFIASDGGRDTGKWAAFTLPLVLGFVILSVLLLAGKLRFDGLYIPRVWERGALLTVCEAVTLLGIMPAMRHKEKPFRAFVSALAIAVGVCTAVWALCTLTLGPELAEKAKMPFFTALRVAKGGELIGRVETLWIPMAFCLTAAKCAACLTAVIYGFTRFPWGKASPVPQPR